MASGHVAEELFCDSLVLENRSKVMDYKVNTVNEINL